MENQADTLTTTITQQFRTLKIDIENSPYKQSMKAEIASSYDKWITEFNSQPTILYLGWKTALTLLTQNQDSIAPFSITNSIDYVNIKVCIVQDPWHLELGLEDIKSAITANALHAYKIAPGEEVENV